VGGLGSFLSSVAFLAGPSFHLPSRSNWPQPQRRPYPALNDLENDLQGFLADAWHHLYQSSNDVKVSLLDVPALLGLVKPDPGLYFTAFSNYPWITKAQYSTNVSDVCGDEELSHYGSLFRSYISGGRTEHPCEVEDKSPCCNHWNAFFDENLVRTLQVQK